jgi:Zn-dependent protease
MFLLAFFVILLLSAVFHEYMHGWAANEMGDPTAKDLGRLTLNPIAHIDPIMTLLLPALLYIASAGQFMFAAAKPVPFNPYNLKYQKYGPALVGIAGPLGNVALAVFFAVIARLPGLPLEFSGVAALVVWVNLLLAIFNLVPLPPLDGSHILLSVLPPHLENVRIFLERYGFYLFIFFLVFFAQWVILPVIYLSQLLLGVNGFAALMHILGGGI